MNTKVAIFQYVPLIANLQAFIKNNDVFDFIMTDQRSTYTNVFKDIQDSIIFFKNPVFSNFLNI